jgi:hypothetical protein
MTTLTTMQELLSSVKILAYLCIFLRALFVDTWVLIFSLIFGAAQLLSWLVTVEYKLEELKRLWLRFTGVMAKVLWMSIVVLVLLMIVCLLVMHASIIITAIQYCVSISIIIFFRWFIIQWYKTPPPNWQPSQETLEERCRKNANHNDSPVATSKADTNKIPCGERSEIDDADYDSAAETVSRRSSVAGSPAKPSFPGR